MSPIPRWALRLVSAPGNVSFQRYRETPSGDLAAVAAACEDSLGLTPNASQLVAARALLAGHGVELDTGEGKTLVGAIAATCHALRGRRVHVLSVNDYLARRDADWMGPLFAAFGVTVAAIGHDTAHDSRRAAYRAQVLYAPVTEIGYDVLRDGIAWEAAERVDPLLDVAIVDEADAVMIDEAVAPLVLAGDSPHAPLDFSREVAIVRTLRQGIDYEFDDQRSTASLTEQGISRAETALHGENLYAHADGEQLSRINVALMAVTLAEKDIDYLVHGNPQRGGSIQLVSASRGRTTKLQRWPDGLHAAVEAKEGIPPSEPGVILDSMTVQELLGRYRSLAGMSGTLLAVASELHEFYGIHTGRVQPNRPNIRSDEPPTPVLDRASKQRAIVDAVTACHRRGRPVLVGTQSVAESEALAAALAGREVRASVLNARNDASEAAVVAGAGDLGAVTISTQMSGRGTDIVLGGPYGEQRDAVLALGGLHIIATSLYPSARLDAQLRGRAGRQGDPGSSQSFVSMEDVIVAENAPGFLRTRLANRGQALTSKRLAEIAATSQGIAEAGRLDQHRATWRYSQAISLQRHRVLAERARILAEGHALTAVTDLDPHLASRLIAEAGSGAAARASRDVALWQLDAAWSEHLAVLGEIRDGIHLRALADADPGDAFHLEALKAFDGFFDGLYSAVVGELARLPARDLAAAVTAAVHRPSATWTYMLVDNPLGTKTDRAVRGLQRMVRRMGGAGRE
ncbi:accessory Sec system translocase SecA2 [Leucobacter sp. G161]|uniref:accessory Sec system translocase SecA2 n=1 Tax=Leucobacter sp. G161 TaxID=663704 RepID=UPI00073B35B1|nr:accessory Sec system translocase SecA2 [Leucobacter sp. G161]KUF06699.1 hypothetical protein AUL38_11790 [Leucobacter sp. G161]